MRKYRTLEEIYRDILIIVSEESVVLATLVLKANQSHYALKTKLHHLIKEGYIETGLKYPVKYDDKRTSRWTNKGTNLTTYNITPKGREYLNQLQKPWQAMQTLKD